MSNEFAQCFQSFRIRLTCPTEHSGANPRRILVHSMQNLVLRKETKLKFIWFPCAEQWFCMGFSQNLKTWISFDFLMYNNVIFMVPMVNASRLTCPSINPIILGVRDRRKAGLPVGRTESLSPIVQTNAKSLNEFGMSNESAERSAHNYLKLLWIR